MERRCQTRRLDYRSSVDFIWIGSGSFRCIWGRVLVGGLYYLPTGLGLLPAHRRRHPHLGGMHGSLGHDHPQGKACTDHSGAGRRGPGFMYWVQLIPVSSRPELLVPGLSIVWAASAPLLNGQFVRALQ